MASNEDDEPSTSPQPDRTKAVPLPNRLSDVQKPDNVFHQDGEHHGHGGHHDEGPRQHSSVTSDGGGRFLTQFLASLHHAASGGFGGLCMEYTSVAMPSFVKDPRTFEISQTSIGIVVGFFYLGTIVGFFIGGFVAQRYSKKGFLLASYFPMAISWIPFMFVSNVPLMVASRVLQGIVYGACSNVSFAYVLEITDAHSRNWALSLWALAIGVGALLLAVCGSLLRWDHLAMLSAVISALFFPLTFKMPDTPVYWLRKNSAVKARQSLTTYRKNTHDVDKELEELKTYLNIADEGFSWKKIYQKMYAWPLAKTVLFNFFKPWMGYTVLIGYTVDIFERSHLSGPIVPHGANIIAQVVDFFAQFGSTFVVSWISRRVQMGVGCMGMAVMHTLNGIYVYAADKHFARHGTLENTYILSNLSKWWPIVGMASWFALYSLGMANALHLFMSETLPQKISSFGMALCFVVLTLNQFVASTFYFQLLETVGLHGVFWILAGAAYFLAACSVILVRDTRNKTLLELEKQHHEADDQRKRHKRTSDSEAAPNIDL